MFTHICDIAPFDMPTFCICAGRVAQNAARNVEVASNIMTETTASQVKELGSQLVKDLKQELQIKSSAPVEELKNLAARLEVLT